MGCSAVARAAVIQLAISATVATGAHPQPTSSRRRRSFLPPTVVSNSVRTAGAREDTAIPTSSDDTSRAFLAKDAGKPGRLRAQPGSHQSGNSLASRLRPRKVSILSERRLQAPTTGQVTYVNGPRVGSSVRYSHCNTWVGSLAEVKAACNDDPACSVLYDWGCDSEGLGWRYCSSGVDDLLAVSMGTDSCTLIAERPPTATATTLTSTDVSDTTLSLTSMSYTTLSFTSMSYTTLSLTATTTQVTDTSVSHTTGSGHATPAVSYVAGPRVGNIVWKNHCYSWTGSLENAKQNCDADPSCSVLFDLNCRSSDIGDIGWRYCTGSIGDMLSEDTTSRACTLLAVPATYTMTVTVTASVHTTAELFAAPSTTRSSTEALSTLSQTTTPTTMSTLTFTSSMTTFTVSESSVSGTRTSTSTSMTRTTVTISTLTTVTTSVTTRSGTTISTLTASASSLSTPTATTASVTTISSLTASMSSLSTPTAMTASATSISTLTTTLSSMSTPTATTSSTKGISITSASGTTASSTTVSSSISASSTSDTSTASSTSQTTATNSSTTVTVTSITLASTTEISSGTLRTTESTTPTGSTTAETFHMTRSAEDNFTSNLTGVEMSNRLNTEVDPADPFNVTAETPLPSLANSTASSNVLLSALTTIHAVGRIALASIVVLSTCSCLVFSKVFVRYRRERAQQKREQESVERLLEIVYGFVGDEQKVMVQPEKLFEAIDFSPDLNFTRPSSPARSSTPKCLTRFGEISEFTLDLDEELTDREMHIEWDIDLAHHHTDRFADEASTLGRDLELDSSAGPFRALPPSEIAVSETCDLPFVPAYPSGTKVECFCTVQGRWLSGSITVSKLDIDDTTLQEECTYQVLLSSGEMQKGIAHHFLRYPLSFGEPVDVLTKAGWAKGEVICVGAYSAGTSISYHVQVQAARPTPTMCDKNRERRRTHRDSSERLPRRRGGESGSAVSQTTASVSQAPADTEVVLVPAHNVRRRFLGNTLVDVYMGPRVGWNMAMIHGQEGEDDAGSELDAWLRTPRCSSSARTDRRRSRALGVNNGKCERPLCPYGHELFPEGVNRDIQLAVCDSCGKANASGAVMYTCRSCNYDMCGKCYWGGGPSLTYADFVDPFRTVTVRLAPKIGADFDLSLQEVPMHAVRRRIQDL